MPEYSLKMYKEKLVRTKRGRLTSRRIITKEDLSLRDIQIVQCITHSMYNVFKYID